MNRNRVQAKTADDDMGFFFGMFILMVPVALVAMGSVLSLLGIA